MTRPHGIEAKRPALTNAREVEWPIADDWNEGETMPNEIMRQRVGEWTDRQIKKWVAEWNEKWQAEGVIFFLRRQAARKYGPETAARLARRLAEIADPERMFEIGEWLIECESGKELLDRVARLCESCANGDGASPS